MSQPNTLVRVILWDIDGTLVDTGSAGERALLAAMQALYQIETSLHDVDYRGRTDRQIARNLLAKHALPVTDENEAVFVNTYLRFLEEELPQRKGSLYPGVQTALDHIDQSEHLHNALLTGNMQRGAQLKLGHYGIWNYFKFGAFANDSRHRPELSAVAFQRTSQHLGFPIDPAQIWVVGDTPHDIDCGKAINARTLAVATGAFSVEELATHQPDVTMANLADVTAFLAHVTH
jgi:phosphoglycolate phosphatase-like HAD superfamily hydrolase